MTASRIAMDDLLGSAKRRGEKLYLDLTDKADRSKNIIILEISSSGDERAK